MKRERLRTVLVLTTALMMVLGTCISAASAKGRSARKVVSAPSRNRSWTTTTRPRTTRTTVPPATGTAKPAATVPATPSPSASTTPPAGPYLFNDEFNGAAGATPDATKWYVSNSCTNFGETNSCPSNANVFTDGHGNLVARISRTGTGYRGALLATVDYEAGAPYWPNHWKAEWQTPYTITARALMPSTPGAWPALWIRSDDGSQELDFAEPRMTFPTVAGCHQHQWSGGVDTRRFDGGATVSNMATNWHVYSATVTASSVTYRVDNQVCGVAYGIPNGSWHNVIIDSLLGAPGSWGSGGAQPAASDPGPWNMLVDYVRVSRI
jgi:hypothetical protein